MIKGEDIQKWIAGMEESYKVFVPTDLLELANSDKVERRGLAPTNLVLVLEMWLVFIRQALHQS